MPSNTGILFKEHIFVTGLALLLVLVIMLPRIYAAVDALPPPPPPPPPLVTRGETFNLWMARLMGQE